MPKISPHFKREEFACRGESCDCGFDTIDAELVRVLEEIREHFDQPITITSGCRCKVHNQVVGGSPGSQHTKGRAADFIVKDVPPAVVVEWLDTNYFDRYGVGLYSGWVHLDTRWMKSRWEG